MWQKKVKNQNSQPVDTASLCARAAAYCSTTEHCRSEVFDKLKDWGADNEQRQVVLDYLEDEGYINEARYARAYTNDKIRFQSWGKKKIRMMLSQKKIAPDYISDAISQFDGEEYLSILRQLMEKKAYPTPIQEVNFYDKEGQKILRFLLSHGFSFSDIRQVRDDIPDEVSYED